MIFIYTGKKISFDKRGVKKQKFFCQGGVNRVSGRRGDSDFALQEGGNRTLPPPMPTCGGIHAREWAAVSTAVFIMGALAKEQERQPIISRKNS